MEDAKMCRFCNKKMKPIKNAYRGRGAHYSCYKKDEEATQLKWMDEV